MRTPSLEELDRFVAQGKWVRPLARRLVRDAHLAEDVAQEAFLQALRRPDAARVSPSAWLSGVVRHLSASLHRSRKREEGDAQEPEGPPTVSTEAIVQKIEIGRLLQEAVLSLDEPYRTVVLLRFFEGLSQRVIAKRLGVPVATVNSRLTRALSKLRERLDHVQGDRGSWLSACLPLAFDSQTNMKWIMGWFLMKKKITYGLVGLSLLAAGTFGVLHVDDKKPSHPTAPSNQETTVSRSSSDASTLDLEETPPVDLRVGEQRRALSSPNLSVEVLVRDRNGNPVAGAEVYRLDSYDQRRDPEKYRRVEASSPDFRKRARMLGKRYVTSEDGRTHIPPTRMPGAVYAFDGDLIGATQILPESLDPLVIDLLGTRTLRVRVVGPRDHVMEDIPVALFFRVNDRRHPILEARTDTFGSATLNCPEVMAQSLPTESSIEVGFAYPGAPPADVVLEETWPEVPIVLEAGPLAGVRVHVRGSDGSAVDDPTLVSVYDTDDTYVVLKEETNRGRADFFPIGTGTRLECAASLRPNLSPITQAFEGPDREGEIKEITLTLSGSVFKVKGRLVNAQGDSVPDGLYFARCESSSSGAPLQWSFFTEGGEIEHEVFVEKPESLEGELILTAQGDPKYRMVRVPAPKPRGTTLDLGTLTFPTGTPYASGQVVDARGQAREGVKVRLVTRNMSSKQWLPILNNATTDSHGHFEIWTTNVPDPVWVQAHTGGPEYHEPVPLKGPREELNLILGEGAVLEARLLIDEDIPRRNLDIMLTPSERHEDKAARAVGWTYGILSEGDVVRFESLRPGYYDLAVSLSGGETPIYYRDVYAAAGLVTRAPEVWPIDLRGLFRRLELDVRDSQGRKVDASLFAFFEDGGLAQLGGTGKAIVLPSKPVRTFVLESEGFLPQSLGNVHGTRKVTLERGHAVSLQWAGEPLPSSPYAVRVELRSTAPPADVPGGKWVESYLRQWGPSMGSFPASGRLELRIPEFGMYEAHMQLVANVQGYEKSVDITPSRSTLRIDELETSHELRADPGKMEQAGRELETFVEQIRKRLNRR